MLNQLANDLRKNHAFSPPGLPTTGGGSSGAKPAMSLPLLTVVKQMSYSWMMDGYKELKSNIKTYLSYKPFFGSRTKPPEYCGPYRPRLLSPLFFCSAACTRLFSLADKRSGTMYLRLWNSCRNRNSTRWARVCPNVFDHVFPQCLITASSKATLANATSTITNKTHLFESSSQLPQRLRGVEL